MNYLPSRSIRAALLASAILTVTACNTTRQPRQTETPRKYATVDKLFCYSNSHLLGLAERSYSRGKTDTRAYVTGVGNKINRFNREYYRKLYESVLADIETGRYRGRSLQLATDVYRRCMTGLGYTVSPSDHLISKCHDYSHLVFFINKRFNQGMPAEKLGTIVAFWARRRKITGGAVIQRAIVKSLRKTDKTIFLTYSSFEGCLNRPPAYSIAGISALSLSGQ